MNSMRRLAARPLGDWLSINGPSEPFERIVTPLEFQPPRDTKYRITESACWDVNCSALLAVARAVVELSV
jgi:hypothetical protein